MKTIPYSTQWITRQDVRAVLKALSSPCLSQGPEVRRFEETVAAYCGVRHAVAVSSGTAALHLACLAAGVGPGQEVITTPLTFLATSNAVLYCGGRPVFADIDRATLNIDLDAFEKSVSPKTKGVMPVHFAGAPVDMKELSAAARKQGLFIIEDAAHALGSRYEGKPVGNCRYSDMTIFSFHPVKSITTAEGGMITTNNPALYAKLTQLRNHGNIRQPALLKNHDLGGVRDELSYPWYYEMQDLGFNYRLSDMHCALGTSQMKRLDAFICRRNEIAALYGEKFRNLSDVVILPGDPASRSRKNLSAWHLYAVLLKLEKISVTRADVVLALRNAGLEAHVHYLPVFLHPYYEQLGYSRDLCPNARWYYERCVSLPLYPRMRNAEIHRVVKCFRDVILKSRKR